MAKLAAIHHVHPALSHRGGFRNEANVRWHPDDDGEKDVQHQHAERVQLCVRLYLVRQGCPRPVSFPVLPALRVYVRPTQEETRSIYP